MKPQHPAEAPGPIANPAAGNYHEAVGSPTINAGINDPANGETDLDGLPRTTVEYLDCEGTMRAVTDIGAYEYKPVDISVLPCPPPLHKVIPTGADEGIEVPASVAPARFYVSQTQHPAEDHTFSFYVYLNVCPTPLLELDQTRLVERPRIGTHKGAAVVTAYLRWPAHLESTAPCPPEVAIKKVVHIKTKRRAADLVFFDGSSSPPRRVFPHLVR